MGKSLVGMLFVVHVLGGCGGGGPAATTLPPSGDEGAPATVQPTAPVSTDVEAQPPARASFAELQQAVIRAKEAAWAARDADKLVAIYAPSAKVSHVGPAGWTEAALPDVKADVKAMMTAFPDAKLTVTRLIGTADRAAIEWTLTGTNQGELMGEEPTGKPFGIRGASFFVVGRDGKVTRESEYFDMPTIVGQIGKGPRGQKFRPVEPAPSGPLEVLVAAPGEEPTSVAVLKKLFERTQMRDHAGIAGLFADDAVISNSYEAADMTKAAMVKHLPVSDKAFVDPGSVVKQCVSAGPYAACEYEWTATWKGPAMGMRPTGKTGTVHELDVVRVKDGKLARVDGYGNSHEFAVAFGIVTPSPPKPSPKAEAPVAEASPAVP